MSKTERRKRKTEIKPRILVLYQGTNATQFRKHVIEKLHDSYIELTNDSEKLLEDPEVVEELKNS